MATDIFEQAVESAIDRLDLRDQLPPGINKDLVLILRERTGRSITPALGESAAISILRPKTASLAFDRVWRVPTSADPIPESIGYYYHTFVDTLLQATGLLILASKELGARPRFDFDFEMPSTQAARNEKNFMRVLSEEHYNNLGISPTIFYQSQLARDAEFGGGGRSVLATALHGLKIVDEEGLSWAQIEEFRNDAQAKQKYRRLIRWLDINLKEWSPNEVIDMLGDRLEDYEWSIKKHGIKTVSGAVSALLDPKFLSGVSVATGGAVLGLGPIWAGLAAGTIVVGKVGAEFARLSIDGEEERRSTNHEIAYVHEVKSRLGQTDP